jgi:transposase
VDWSWSEHAVCVVDEAGAAVERATVKHSAAGLGKLVTLLHRHQVAGVAIERGDGPVVQALLDAGAGRIRLPPRSSLPLSCLIRVTRN